MRQRLRAILQPHLVFLPLVLVGFCCWLLPAWIIGIYRKSELSIVSLLVAGSWYLLIVAACLLARRAAAPLVWVDRAKRAYSPIFYYTLSGIALVGTMVMLGTLGSFAQILEAVREQQVNDLKMSLYSSYSAGVLTLRYAAALAGVYALYRLVILRKLSLLDTGNILLVLVCAFISARIMLIQTAFFFLFVFVNQPATTARRSFKLGRIQGAALVGAAFVAIVGFTYLRSANTYKYELGITNPVAVTGVELSRYAGMPIQVTVGVGEIIATTDVVERTRVRPVYLAPTFFQPDDIEGDNSGGVGKQWYLGLIDLPPTLTTNSAMAALVGYLGYWSFLAMPLVCFLHAFIFFAFRALNTFEARLYQGVTLYAFFEIWRLYFFSAGTFIFMNLLMLGFFAVQVGSGRLALGRRAPQRPALRGRPVPAHLHARR